MGEKDMQFFKLFILPLCALANQHGFPLRLVLKKSTINLSPFLSDSFKVILVTGRHPSFSIVSTVFVKPNFLIISDIFLLLLP